MVHHVPHVLPALILAAMVILAGTSNRWGRPGAIVLALLSIGWLLTNQKMEGPTLLSFTRAHGFTGGDLAGLAGLVIAVWRYVGSPWPQRR